jgi:hypothetical protein
MKVAVPKGVYASEVVMLSVQPYLADYFVAVSEDGDVLRISMSPRKSDVPPANEGEFLNHLQHATFRCQRQRETAELRRILLERAFSHYR